MAGAGFALGHAENASDRIVYDGTTGKLFFDADGSGSGAATLIAILTGHPALSAGDILVV